MTRLGFTLHNLAPIIRQAAALIDQAVDGDLDGLPCLSSRRTNLSYGGFVLGRVGGARVNHNNRHQPNTPYNALSSPLDTAGLLTSRIYGAQQLFPIDKESSPGLWRLRIRIVWRGTCQSQQPTSTQYTLQRFVITRNEVISKSRIM